MYVPKAFGGLELTLPEIIRIVEGISWADGSSGWVVTLCSGAAWFIGFFDPSVAADIFRSGQVCIAGSGAINGTAMRSSKGYQINGVWPYATGSLIATVFTANCSIWADGAQLCKQDGTPMVQSFLLMPEEVAICRTWNAMGMIATGTHSIEVQNTIIPENRSFIIDPRYAVLPDLIFRYPFLQLAEITLTVNLSGMACRFLDLTRDKFKGKGEASSRMIAEGRSKLQSAREQFYRVTDAAWISLTVDGFISDGDLIQITNASRHLASCSMDTVTLLYPFCGLEAANTAEEINRVWRNFHTAIHHNIFRGLRS
jgi:alkylation response protein AidB-like acyl-CoA dehydrogenase